MDKSHSKPNVSLPFSRREFLRRAGMGMGSIGLASLLAESAGAMPTAISPLAPRHPMFRPTAKRVIHIFPEGGPSHVDTFDHKPLLEKFHGRLVQDVIKDYYSSKDKTTEKGRLSGKLQRSGFKFSKHGQSGLEISELFPKLAQHADELCVINSMSTKSSVHELAQLYMTCGHGTLVRPSLGSWTIYGLGTENQNLPAFVALSPSGSTASGEKHWSNAFLPGWSRGVGISTRNSSVEKMIENLRSGATSIREQRRQLDLLADMNREHSADRPDSLLEGRIQSFETAFRMQIEATDAFDLEREPLHIREMYGDTEQGKQILLARRLVERGVRFVQVWHTGWDTHDLNDERHRELCLMADQPVAALIADLKQRDMLKDTLILWGGEFGRTPTTDNNEVSKKKSIGRDHNSLGFTVWMAGGGAKGGYVHGTSDDFGAVAAEKKMDIHDLHATMLHMLGMNHELLTYRHAGRDYRMTDLYGNVINELLA